MILPTRTRKGGLLVVICTAVDRGRPKDTLKPSNADASAIEGAVARRSLQTPRAPRLPPTPVEYHLVSIYSILLFWQKMNRGGRLLPGQAMKEGHQISLLLLGEVQRLDLLGEVRIGGSPFVVKLDHLH